MFTYMADAATIALCGSERLPVAMEADYKALEAAYLKERPQLGQAMLVRVEGRIEPRPSRRGALRRHLAPRGVRQPAGGQPVPTLSGRRA